MNDRKAESKRLIRNSTAEFLIFTAQAGEQRKAARYEADSVVLRPLPMSSKGVQA